MPNADKPSKGRSRADNSDHGKGGRPGSPDKNTGTRSANTGSDLSSTGEGLSGGPSSQQPVTGQKNKPGIGQPGRGGDDLSGRGMRHDDATGIDDEQSDERVQADTESGDRDKFNSPGRAGNPTGRGESRTPGSSPDGGSNAASRQHSPKANTDKTGSAEQTRSGQPRSTGEETLGGNQGAM